MKKFLAILLTVALTATIAVGGTLAYLTGEDSDVNVMTFGNVKIEQHEYERAIGTDGNYETIYAEEREEEGYKLTDFTQAKPLYPATGAVTGWDKMGVCFEQLDGNKLGRMQVLEGLNNVQDKFVFVENTGKTDAYVRTLIAFEVGSMTNALTDDYICTSVHNYWTANDVGVVVVDGNSYYVVEFVYDGTDGANAKHPDGIVHPGDFTYNSLAQVYMANKATNEDVEAIDGNGNGAYDILVLSQAVQADGFDDAQTAFEEAFGNVAENAAEWFDGVANYQFVGAETAKYALEGEAAAEVLAALNNGEDLIVDPDMDIIAFDTNEVDAQGATVSLNGVGADAYGYLAFLPDAGENVTVSNLNVTGSGFVEVGHYGQGGGIYTLNDIKIIDLQSTLANGDKGNTLGCAFMGFGDTELNNCVIKGTTAQEGVMAVDLGCGQAWKGYTDDNDNKISTTVNGGEYGTIYCWSHSVVTINGAKVDTMYVAPVNGSVTIKEGSEIGTININYSSVSQATDARLAKIVIEEGATVDAIVFDGTTYTLAEWNAR